MRIPHGRLVLASFMLAAVLGAAVIPRDALRDAFAKYRQLSSGATEACANKLSDGRRALLEAYGKAIRTATAENDDARTRQLTSELAAITEAIEKAKSVELHDTVAEVLSGMIGLQTRPDLPNGLESYFGLNEGLGRQTMDAMHATVFNIGTAEWIAAGDGYAVEFMNPEAVIAGLKITLGAQWTVIMRINFPSTPSSNPHSTLMATRAGRHHVIIQGGEIGVWFDRFFGSGLMVKSMAGWHILTVMAHDGKTMFYVDGKQKGISEAAVTDEISSIGGIGYKAGDGLPQNIGATIDFVAVYQRILQKHEFDYMQ